MEKQAEMAGKNFRKTPKNRIINMG